jgi:endoglucanase
MNKIRVSLSIVILPALLLIINLHFTFAADLIRVAPVTNKILMIEFDEGHIDYHGKGQDRYNGNICYYSALDVSKAGQLSNYTLVSSDDNRYAQGKHPINIGRKAKGVDFNNIYEDPVEPEHIKTHWLYIEVPYVLIQGKSYTIRLNNLASNTNEFTFIFDVFSQISETIHVNQIGFVPNGPKYAYLSHFMGDFNTAEHPKGGLKLDGFSDSNFHVVKYSDNQIVYTGKIALRTRKTNAEYLNENFNNSNPTLADVWECDFSDYAEPGEFKIVVDSIGCSFPFEIGNDVYREAFYYTMRALFMQRSGIEKDLGFFEPGMIYHRDHHPDDEGVVMKLSTTGDNVEGVWGWYHDAGDWDGYPSHKRVPLALLMLYDLAPEKFADGEIGNRYKLSASNAEWIDEAGNGIPDLLDEAMWLINFYKRAKDALLEQGLGTGGVPGYVGVDAGADLPAWEDKREMSLEPENVEMTYAYAACAAWLAICLDKANNNSPHPQSAGWIAEAEAAYDWAKSHGSNPRGQEMAAAALYRYTAISAYQTDFQTAKSNDDQWNWALADHIQDGHFAATCFSLIPDAHSGLNTSLRASCRNDLINRAIGETVNTSNKRGYRLGSYEYINFMLGVFSAPHISLAAAAYTITGESKYLDACYNTCSYQLGGNELNQTYISGVGERPDPAPFRPDAWFMIDYNSMVYRNPIFPGYLPYGHHKTCDWFGCGFDWVGDEDYSRSTAYPAIENFPDAEARFWNRFNIPGSEFTIHQTQNQAIFAFGFLCGSFTLAYPPNERPTVSLNLSDGETIDIGSVKTLTVNASADTRRIEYYYDWHYIGESTDAEDDFIFNWHVSNYKVSPGKSALVTAVAYDDRGLISKPTEEGDRTVSFVGSTDVNFDNQGSTTRPVDGLFQNYPNPFNSETVISYSLSENRHITIKAHDLQGREVALLVEGIQPMGRHNISWDMGTLPSGIYFVSMRNGDRLHTIKITHLQ